MEEGQGGGDVGMGPGITPTQPSPIEGEGFLTVDAAPYATRTSATPAIALMAARLRGPRA